MHGISSDTDIERVVEFNNENKLQHGFKSTRQRINELARPDASRSQVDPEVYNMGPDILKRAKHFTKIDDVINCTFRPKVRVALSIQSQGV